MSGTGAPLSAAAKAFRSAHALIAIGMLLAIAYVWFCAITGRRDRLLLIATTALVGEGAVVAANHGDCPLGPLQERVGDPVPLFELLLPPKAAKLAVPALGAVAGAGIAAGAVRRQLPRGVQRNVRTAISSAATPHPATTAS
jgi:hypothetical protein